MVERINHYAGLWMNWQWAMLWQTAILVAVVALIDRLTRKWAWPQLRYALWLLILVKLVLPPTLTSPVSLTSMIPTLARQAIPTQTTGGTALTDAPPRQPIEQATSPTPEPVAFAPQAHRNQALPPVAEPAQTSPVLATAESLSWTAYAMGAWLLGVVSLAMGLAVYLRRFSADHAPDRPENVPAWFDNALAQTAAEIGLRRVPRVVFSTKVCCPAVFGLLRPLLLFPADRITTMTRREARHVLLHELAHIKRGDLLTHGVYMVLVTLYWFNPLLWLIRKHMQNLRELCCDATVAKCLREETHAYRDTLLTTGRALLAQPFDPGLGLLGLFEDANWLTVRLHWLQRKTWSHPWPRRAFLAAVITLMLGCILPMASLHAAPDKTTDTTCKLTLPNGATIELLGLYSNTLKRWWRPDGTPLDEGPDDPDSRDSDIGDNIEIALRYENLPQGAKGGFGIEPGRNPRGGAIPLWYTTAQKAGQPVENVSWVNALPEKGAETTTLKVHVAMGAWETFDTYPRTGRTWNATASGGIIFSAPYERAGRTHATVTHAIEGRDIRVTAFDVNNVEHVSDYPGGLWTSAGFSQIAPDFDVPLDDVAVINLQTRPYTWIEFKNVSLVPGQSHEVQIVTTEPEKPKEDKPPVDIAIIREHSPTCLRAFRAAVMRYIEEHGPTALPEKPWFLKIQLPDSTHIAGVQFVRSVGYFGPQGFRSLRPEHFMSSIAPSTPIMYCTRLLEAEKGKGTNVLFGDGRVEWVTARQLAQLKAKGMPEHTHRQLEKPKP